MQVENFWRIGLFFKRTVLGEKVKFQDFVIRHLKEITMSDSESSYISDIETPEELPSLEVYVVKKYKDFHIDAPFYVSVYEKRGRLLGRKKTFYRKYWVGDVLPNPAKETLIRKGEGKILFSEFGSEWWPIEKAKKEISMMEVVKEKVNKEVVKELVVPQRIIDMAAKTTTIHKHPDQEDPPKDSPPVLINVPYQKFVDGIGTPGENSCSYINGKAVVRFSSGAVYSFDVPSRLWDLMGTGDYFVASAKRSKKIMEDKGEDERRRLLERIAQLESIDEDRQRQIQNLEERLNNPTQSPKQKEVCITAPEETDFEYTLNREEEKTVSDFRTAASLNVIAKMRMFSRDKASTYTAEDWLRMGAATCRLARIEPSIAGHVLNTRLDVKEANEMNELMRHMDNPDSFAEYCEKFLAHFAKMESALTLLRTLQKAKMSTEDVEAHNYLEFGTSLEKKAEECYRRLKIRRDLWPEMNKVLVFSAFVRGIEPSVAHHLTLKGLESLQDNYREARLFAQSHMDSFGKFGQGGKARVNMTYGEKPPYKGAAKAPASQAKNDKENGQEKASFKPRFWSPLCKRCRAKENPPAKCDHCRNCFKLGHHRVECPLLAQQGGETEKKE